MKTKITKILIVAVLAVTLVFTLTACGGFRFGRSGGNNGTDTEQTDTGGGDTDNDEDDTPKYNLTIPFVSFGVDSWATVAAISASGIANRYYNIGDEKTFNLTSGEPVTVLILGFDHDNLSDGTGKAGITLGMKHLLARTARMNATNTNVGGWAASEMRNTTFAEIYELIPADLKAVIKTVDKSTNIGGGGTTVGITAERLFLFSNMEIAGSTSWGAEGAQYDWWKLNNTNADRIKRMFNGHGNAASWALRSASSVGETQFRFVDTSGSTASPSSATTLYGLCFGFCI